MKFSTRTDIHAPIGAVFAEVSNFARFERQALRRGIDVTRENSGQTDGSARWQVAFEYRGKKREFRAQVVTLRSPESLVISTTGAGGIEGELDVELVELTKTKTRLKVGVEMLPRNISARLLIQSLKFAKARLDRKFTERVADFGKDIEERCSGGAGR